MTLGLLTIVLAVVDAPVSCSASSSTFMQHNFIYSSLANLMVPLTKRAALGLKITYVVV
jgi:hypothetical protein